MAEPLIRLEKVDKSFWGIPVLRRVDLDIPLGEITTIIGKSGVGKSVTLKLMIGLMEPDRGEVYYGGRPVSAMSGGERRDFRRKMSYLFQNNALFDSLSVGDNVALPLRERARLSEEEVRRRVGEKMSQLDLAGSENKYPSELSGGMKKRVSLARALVTDPEVVLFDEPTTGLDPVRKAAVHSMIADYQKRFGFTGVVVSHEIPDIFSFSQHIAMIDEGTVRFSGSPEGIQSSEDPVVRQFIHGLEARHDDLTGMSHAPRIGHHFREEMRRRDGFGIPFSLLLLTVENMDEINARLGYVAGQEVLKRLGTEIWRHLRDTDTSARFGPGRIAVLLGGEDLQGARRFSEKLTGELTMQCYFEREIPAGLGIRLHVGAAGAAKGMRLEDLVAAAERDRNTILEMSICAKEGR